MLMLSLTAAVLGIAVIAWGFHLTPAQRLSVAAFLAVPQFFVPGVPVSLADAWIALISVLAFTDKRVRLGRPSFLLPVFILAGLYLVAQLWSEAPFSQTNMLVIFRLLGFAVLTAYALSVAADDPKNLLRSFRWAVPWILIQAALTSAFRFNPALEAQFYSSRVGDFLVGSAASGLTNGLAINNVLDPVKAGGLYVNANVASMYFGVAFFLLLAAKRAGASRWYYVWALISWAAVWTTSSKTGAALALALPVAAFLVPRMARGNARLMLLPVVLLMIPAGVWLPDFIAQVAPEYADNSEVSLGSRGVLWEAAGILFGQHPWLGLGFGGWTANIGSILGFNSLPPHNMIIAAWANAGILAAASIIVFLVTVAVSFALKILASENPAARKTMAYGLMALAWMSIHAMGDNTTFYGETRTAFFAAVALAYYFAAAGAEPGVSAAMSVKVARFDKEPTRAPR
ncbi:O-antigen ligase family protein [Pseudarthrobacter scleromae]|uniref:O-antigen ligase family protein n=1 Tax=Pseudarthrobacter scleromae TaxID=158897 RepID=UPI00362A9D95